ncbi:MAG: type transport system permease protein [Actinomycetota bacterium]|nr:type transport system permease protein [Actinomycetota bacterium]
MNGSDVMVLTGRHLLHFRRSPGRFIGIAMNPLVMLLAMGYLFRRSIVVPGSGDYVDFLMAGVAAQVGLASVGPAAIGVSADLREGIVDRFRTMPVAQASVLLGRTVADLLLSAVALLVVTTVGLMLGWRPHTGAWSVIVGFGLLLGFLYAMEWFGVVLGLLLREAETIDSIGALVLVLLSFLSSAFLSIQGLPEWIRPIAAWNPVSVVVSACRLLWGSPAAPTPGLPGQYPLAAAWATVVLLLVVFVPLASHLYRRAAER